MKAATRRRRRQREIPGIEVQVPDEWRGALQSIEDQIRAGYLPEPELTVSEWADQYRRLDSKSSAEPGRWRTSRTPYLREIMDALSPSCPDEFVVFVKGTQLGATECGNNWLGYVIHRAPGPMLYVQPTLEQAEAYSKQRVAPMIEGSPILAELIETPRSRDSGNTIRVKEFPGGMVRMIGANSPSSLASMPIRYLFFDEVDRYGESAGTEGDPIEIGLKRSTSYKRNRKVFLASSPGTKGLSRIEAAYEHSDKRVYEIPCPRCGEFQPLTWAAVRWDKSPDEKTHYPETVRIHCLSCGKPIQEHEKTEFLAKGRWTPTADGDGRTRGYHLNALYSPLGWYSWEDAVRDFLRAKRGGLELLKVWTNTVLAETWEEKGERVNEDTLFARREKYAHEAPEGVLTITAGVDVQADRVEIEIVGWGKGEESWSLDYRVVRGEFDREDVQSRLDDLVLHRTFRAPGGDRFHIQATGIDYSYASDAVEAYVEEREIRNVWALKGMAGSGRKIVQAAQQRRRGRSPRRVHLYIVGVDEAKRLLYARLRLREPGPGYCHFPIGEAHEEEYFRQLTAERRVIRYSKGFPRAEWVLPSGRRNEALDCRVYATAALYLLDPEFEVIARKLERRRRRREQGGEERPADPREPARRRRRGSGWVQGWRR